MDSFFFLLISPFVGNTYTFYWSRVVTQYYFDFRCTTVDSAITYITKCSYPKFTFSLPLTSPVFLLLNIIAYTEIQALFYLFTNFSSITERVNFLHVLKYYLLLWSSKLIIKFPIILIYCRNCLTLLLCPSLTSLQFLSCPVKNKHQIRCANKMQFMC